MKLTAVCLGQPTVLPGKRAITGIDKRPAGGAVIVDAAGLAGDAVCNTKHHGGPDQAVYAFGTVDLDWWSREMGRTLAPGFLGENLVIDGIDSRTVAIGDRFETETLLLEVTSTRTPCSTLSTRMGDPHFARRFNEAGRPGFYCRVLRAGIARAGDAVMWHPFPGARIAMPELLRASMKTLSPGDRARYLATPLHAKLRRSILEAGGVHHSS